MPDYTKTAARLSEDGVYRYTLDRVWDPALGTAVWLMLNPSVADHQIDDPTIRKVVGFSSRWGCGSVRVVNLFALRSTDPSGLLAHPDPVGPDNDAVIRQSLVDARLVIVGWGAHPFAADRAVVVSALAAEIGCPVGCLGTTNDGSPRHPLFVSYDTLRSPWGPHLLKRKKKSDAEPVRESSVPVDDVP